MKTVLTFKMKIFKSCKTTKKTLVRYMRRYNVVIMQHQNSVFLVYIGDHSSVCNLILNVRPCVSIRGVNVVPFLDMIGLPETFVGLLRDSSSGYALTAYAMYKVTEIRLTFLLTVLHW